MLNSALNKIIDWHRKLNPPTWWKTVRFAIHWMTLPLKVMIIGSLGLAMIIRNCFIKRNKGVTDHHSPDDETRYVVEFWKKKPLIRYGTRILHVLRVPAGEEPTGKNHNTDHQLARHGVLVAINQIDGNCPQGEISAMYDHIVRDDGQLLRGYHVDDNGDRLNSNDVDVSGDMLVGLIFGSTHCSSETQYQISLINTLGQHLLVNDYAIKSGNKKSDVAMWEPGIFTVGAQAVTILAALRFCYRKTHNLEFLKRYLWLFYFCGYGLLSLFPTAFLPSRRGYNNDNVVIQALYSLIKNTDSSLERFVYKFAILYTWLLSFPYYNGFFTGLVHDVTGLIPRVYRQRCLNYLTVDGWSAYSRSGWSETSIMKSLPLPPQLRNNGEFGPVDEDQETGRLGGFDEYVSVLGWLSSYTLIKKSLDGGR